MSFRFLVDTYATERLKTLTVWSQFGERDLEFRPEPRARSVREQFVHQCLSENGWFVDMLGWRAGGDPLPDRETRLGFLERYAEASADRLHFLESRSDPWFEQETSFFEVRRSRAWILVRRIAHSAHHRGQLTAYHRMLGHALYSTYGPTADTGGLPKDEPEIIYPYDSVGALLEGERSGGRRPPLPGPGAEPPTERPDGRRETRP